MKFDGWLAVTALQFGGTAAIGVALSTWMTPMWALSSCGVGAVATYVACAVVDALGDRRRRRERGEL